MIEEWTFIYKIRVLNYILENRIYLFKVELTLEQLVQKGSK